MTTLMLQPFALRQGKLSSGLTLEEIHETLARAHSVVLQASRSQVKMSWGSAFMLDYPDGTFESELPGTAGARLVLRSKLQRHDFFRRVLPKGQIRFFFNWSFASHKEGDAIVQPKGLTMTSHDLMVTGAKLSMRDRSFATAHEIGHALLGSDSSVHRDDDRGNLMFGDLGGVGGRLDDTQLRFFVENAARVAAGTNIVNTEMQYKKPA